MNLNDFLLDFVQSEYKMFHDILNSIPAAEFSTDNPNGGHSAAWHALHITDWTRFMGMGDRTPASFGYFGWENADWAQPFLGPKTIAESASKAEILARLDQAQAEFLAFISKLSEAELSAPYLTPFGEVTRAAGIARQVRHVAVHRGQMRLNVRQVT